MTVRTLPVKELHLILPLLAQVHTLHAEAQPHRYSDLSGDAERLDWLTNWVVNDNVHALVAGPPHAPTAYIVYACVTKPDNALSPAQQYAVLEHVCVDSKHRRKGLARQLIAAMRQHLDATGFTHIRVKYAGWNKASAALMAREGFVVSHIEAEATLAPR